MRECNFRVYTALSFGPPPRFAALRAFQTKMGRAAKIDPLVTYLVRLGSRLGYYS